MSDNEDPAEGEATADDKVRKDSHWSEADDRAQQSEVRLELKDYVAIFIASLETVFLPLIIAMIIIVVIALSFRLLT